MAETLRDRDTLQGSTGQVIGNVLLGSPSEREREPLDLYRIENTGEYPEVDRLLSERLIAKKPLNA